MPPSSEAIPEFPITVTFEDRSVEKYDSITDIACNLEEYSSVKDLDCEVVDALGRTVILVVEQLDVKVFGLKGR
jgi:hypothetical protein